MKNFSAKRLGIIGSVVAAIVVIGAGIFWLLSSKGFDLSADNAQSGVLKQYCGGRFAGGTSD